MRARLVTDAHTRCPAAWTTFVRLGDRNRTCGLVVPDHALSLLSYTQIRFEEGTGIEPDSPRGNTPLSRRVSCQSRRYLPEDHRPQWRESNPAFVRAYERIRRAVNAADRRFTGSTAVAAEGIEPSQTRVWAASVPSTSCGHDIANVGIRGGTCTRVAGSRDRSTCCCTTRTSKVHLWWTAQHCRRQCEGK
jgi:hypothetical protein